MVNKSRLAKKWLVILWLLMPALGLRAQTNLSIFSDQLDHGFGNWSWGADNFANASPVHSGAASIAFTGGAWEAISMGHSQFDPGPYTNLSFWINGGAGGGQIIQVSLDYGTNQSTAYQLAALPAGLWQQYSLPFAAFDAANVTNLYRVTFQITSFGTVNPFYLDDISLFAIAPSVVHLGVDATRTVRPADSRWFGLNTAVWDASFDTTATANALAEAGTRILRFPGGSLSDQYHWSTDTSLTNTWTWGTSFSSFVHIATNVGVQAMITVNYGTGTPAEAAAWVKSANVTNHLGFKYWEVGNECYGTWETDSNHLPNDPYTYAVRAAQYMTQMRAAFTNIEIGVVSAPGENTFSNNATHFAINPRTGTTNYGWTPILLSTLKSLGAKPDFLIHHVYPEYGSDDDQMLLLESGNWAADAGDLRQQISDYFGSGGTNIELLATENNSDAGNQGRQSTSVVNGLYLADSLAHLMKTEFNSFIWWDLRNGTDTSGDFSPDLFGWRTYGDLGVINGLNTRHPVYYVDKLLQYFAQPGDTILSATTDFASLAVYASRKADGSLAVLAVNKDRYATFSSRIALTNYLPWTNCLVRSFGIAQDEATRTNSPVPGSQDVSTNYLAVTGTNFAANFPPYSVTLLTIPPAAPRLVTLPVSSGPLVFQVQGQAEVRYILQSSVNLTAWVPAATNVLATGTWNVTNSLPGSSRFWRAVWLAQ